MAQIGPVTKIVEGIPEPAPVRAKPAIEWFPVKEPVQIPVRKSS